MACPPRSGRKRRTSERATTRPAGAGRCHRARPQGDSTPTSTGANSSQPTNHPAYDRQGNAQRHTTIGSRSGARVENRLVRTARKENAGAVPQDSPSHEEHLVASQPKTSTTYKHRSARAWDSPQARRPRLAAACPSPAHPGGAPAPAKDMRCQRTRIHSVCLGLAADVCGAQCRTERTVSSSVGGGALPCKLRVAVDGHVLAKSCGGGLRRG